MNYTSKKDKHLQKFIYLFLLPFLIYTFILVWLSKQISFLSDDWKLISFNSFSYSNLFATNWHGFARAGGLYRPLIKYSLYLNYLIFGGQSASFHITNVLIHSLSSLLVIFLYREIISKNNYWHPFLACFLFFVLPIHTDSIFWVAGRTDTVCAIFFFLTVIYFSRYISSPSMIAFLISGLCLWGALLSKEMSMSLPGVFIIIALHKQKLFKKDTLYILLFSLISYFVYFFIRLYVLGSFLEYAANTNFSLRRIFGSIIIASLSIFRTNTYYVSIGILLVTFFIALLSLKNRIMLRDIFFLCSVFLLILIPVLGRITRWYLYIPSAFACLILVRIWSESIIKKPIIIALFSGLLLYYGATLIQEGFVWINTSKISGRILETLIPYIKDEKGRVFLINVPSAYSPDCAVGEKPIFAYNLDIALADRLGKKFEAIPVVLNHLWLLKDYKFGISSIKKINQLSFLVECSEKGLFSFHTSEFVSGRLKPINTTLSFEWGKMNIINQHRLFLEINSYKGEKILFYDGFVWSCL